jgi:hypothetical protein
MKKYLNTNNLNIKRRIDKMHKLKLTYVIFLSLIFILPLISGGGLYEI